MSLEPTQLLLYAGYAWNGASGPVPDTKTIMRASLYHDAWYQLIREGHEPRSSRTLADFWFGETYKEDGGWKWLADSYVKVLEKVGEDAIDHPYHVLTAP